MKYQNVNWELNIECENQTDEIIENIAEQINNGFTNGSFDIDCTNYNKLEHLKQELETELGREIDYKIGTDKCGELADLYKIAKNNEDDYIMEIIENIYTEEDWDKSEL